MFDTPDGWKPLPLGEVAHIIMGQSPPSSAVGSHQIGLPFTQGNSEFGEIHPSPTLYSTETPKIAEHGDILLSVRAPVGAVNIAECRLCIGRGLAALRAENCDGWFLFYTIRGMTQSFARLSQGSTFDAINGGELRQIPILLPPLDEQRRIAEVLRSVDKVILIATEVAMAMGHTSQNMRHELLRVSSEGEPLDLPIEWTLKPLETIASVERGKFSVRPRNDPQYFGGRTPFIQTGDITGAGDFLSAHNQSLNDLGVGVSKVFPAGTILTTIAANIGDFTISTYPVAAPDSVVGISPLDGVDTFWLYCTLTCFKAALDRASTQNAQKNINLQTLRPLLIPVPPKETMGQLSQTLASSAHVARSCRESVQGVKALREIIMADLLSGRVRVPA